ncbi:MAG TPA: V-type ATPase 116kDa subunit family protein, partial [Polyangia bacterium]
AVARAAALERQLVEADQCFPRTAATRLIAGWIPAADAAAVAAQLRAATGGRCQLELTPPGASDQADVPVLLRPPWPLRPFAMLVAGFGLPAYRELDPTLFLAVSYLLMFGMMFGDAGHGAVLVLAGALARRVDRRVGWLLVYAGLASIGFGVVYGSYFGITALKEHALWRDPLEGDPLTLMRAAVGLGATMITLGLVLNIINRFRRGDVIGGLLDKFGVAGVIFYWGALLLATRYATLAAQGLVTTAVVLVLGLPLAAFALRGPLEVLARRRRAGRGPAPGGLGAALAESLLDPFEAVLVYLANTVSFVRLAAYALSHAALLLATFMLAAELRRASAAGTVWSVLVVIAGNGIAIVLEAIVAAVQALRLEYYEFFGKFFSGAGRPFQPFRVEGALDRMAARYREAGGGKECDTRKTPGG